MASIPCIRCGESVKLKADSARAGIACPHCGRKLKAANVQHALDANALESRSPRAESQVPWVVVLEPMRQEEHAALLGAVRRWARRALAWCGACAVLGGYMVWRGPSWWAPAGLVPCLLIAMFALAKTRPFSLLIRWGKASVALAALLWLGGLGMALYAVAALLPPLGGVGVAVGGVGLLLFLLAPPRER